MRRIFSCRRQQRENKTGGCEVDARQTKSTRSGAVAATSRRQQQKSRQIAKHTHLPHSHTPKSNSFRYISTKIKIRHIHRSLKAAITRRRARKARNAALPLPHSMMNFNRKISALNVILYPLPQNQVSISSYYQLIFI